MMFRRLSGLIPGLMFLATTPALACELCAIYSADSARGSSTSGFLFSISEQFTPYRVVQFEGEEIDFGDDYLDNSITHVAPTYNFSARFGVSLSIPIVYNSFKRSDFRYSTTPPSPVFETERGSEFGLGDLALIARGTVLQISKMNYGVTINVLTGVKFPTGDDGRIEDEIEQVRIFESFLPPGTPHDPLSHSLSGVHEHSLALGSGSYDGIFGVTLNTRWKRWFFNSQAQYYLRTEGRHDFEFGDELLVSGGPGGYLVLHDSWTLSLQFNGFYETEARDKVLGRKSDRTGMTVWYVGPQMALTWGERFAANAGGDVPLRIANNGLQNVPEYRIHGGLSWRF